MRETKFKQTEVGLIPMDWNIVSIGEMFKFLPTNTLSREFLTYSKASIKNIHYGDVLVKYGEIIDIQNDEVPYISDSMYYKRKTYAANGDIIIADTAEDEIVGKCCELTNIRNEFVESGLHTICIRSKNEKFASGYLGYALNSTLYHNQLLPLQQGIKVLSISKAAIEETFLVFPKDVVEQSRIASALSDVDALLSSLDKVIAKKQAIKEGTMQQLLTGKTRLKGFKGEWVKRKFREIGTTYSGLLGKTAADFGHGTSKYVTFINVIYNTVIDPRILDCVEVSSSENQNAVQKGDLLLNTSSETPEEVGMCSYVAESISHLYLNSFCFGFRVNNENVCPLFLSYLLRSVIGRSLMQELAQGSTRYNLPKKIFLLSALLMPDNKTEQRAIAAILTEMDDEIAALQAKRKKYEAVKQGMMQQLLTGRIRLI